MGVFYKEYSKNINKEEVLKQMTDLYVRGIILIFKQAIENKERSYLIEILQKQIIKKQVLQRFPNYAKILYYKANQALQDIRERLDQKDCKFIEDFLNNISQ